MSAPYPVVEVESTWAHSPEGMGARNKFWYRDPRDGANWLFKYPRPDTGEHWAEKIAAEVAAALRVERASVELAEHEGAEGSASRSFLGKYEGLFHGNEVLEVSVPEYDRALRFGQSDHSLDNVRLALGKMFVDPRAAVDAKRSFAGYVLLDAVIGNTDRHHENWGLVRWRDGEDWYGRMAPSFDHASSLGRELRDERREMLLGEDRIAWYAAKGRGALYLASSTQRGPSPLELARQAVRQYPDDHRDALDRLEDLDDHLLETIVRRVPSPWMSEAAREFAVALMLPNRDQLLEAR